jgi:hypothetical protein
MRISPLATAFCYCGCFRRMGDDKPEFPALDMAGLVGNSGAGGFILTRQSRARRRDASLPPGAGLMRKFMAT